MHHTARPASGWSPRGPRSIVAQHIPALDGIRAVAALGIIVTHVSFQVGTGWALADRFDYFVAVFFALSAFLLYRRRHRHSAREYFRNRVARLAPAYLVCVFAVLLLLPEAASVTPLQVASNLTATQLYAPGALAPGLTHLWSLCVEIAFYLALPLITWALRGCRRGLRVAAIGGVAVISLGWAWLPFVQAYGESGEGVNYQIWPPAYAAWFAVGMLAAEWEGHVSAGWQRLLRVRWAWLALAAACMWLASREFFGPVGLEHPSPSEFSRRVLIGAIFAACVVVPFAVAPGGTRLDAVLDSEPAQALGRWSYSIFLWHMALISVAFPLTGVSLFAGGWVNFVVILALTVGLTVPVAAASYTLVEAPAARWLRGVTKAPRAAAHSSVRATESPA